MVEDTYEGFRQNALEEAAVSDRLNPATHDRPFPATKKAPFLEFSVADQAVALD